MYKFNLSISSLSLTVTPHENQENVPSVAFEVKDFNKTIEVDQAHSEACVQIINALFANIAVLNSKKEVN